MAAKVVLFLLNEIEKLKQMWSFLNVLNTVLPCVAAYQIVHD